jgi:thiamine transporter
MNSKVILLTEAAIMCALAVILSFIKFNAAWGYGGSVSLEMLPIVLFAFRRGVKWGIVVGAVYGILNAIINPYIVHPIQFLLDYPVAFLLVGFAGVFSVNSTNTFKKNVSHIILGTALGSALRLVSHFISGVVWFGSYAPKGTPVTLYSFVYNLGYLLPSCILIIIVLSIIVKTAPRLFEVK